MTRVDEAVRAIAPPDLPTAPAQRFAYSYGVQVGSTLHISGMVAFDADGAIVGEGDPAAQAVQVFENLKAVLEAAGGGLDDLVSTTTYLTDMAHSLAVNDVRARYLTGDVPPTSTLVGVAALARPQFLVEISGVAVLGSGTAVRTVDTPVLIVGRGPVGMTLALRLARFGVPSVLADRVDAEIRLSSKAVLMHGESVEVLERAGVGREVARTGIALSGSRTFYRDRELFHTEFGPAPEHGFPQVLNFPQSETERLLLARVQAEPLVDLQLGTELTELVMDPAGVTAGLDDGADGLRVRAEYVAGCDGARSTVRKQLPIAFSGHSHDDHYLIVDVRAQLALPHERRFYFDPPSHRGRTILVHPQHGDLWHLDFQVGAAPDLDEELRTGRLDERIRGVIGPARYELVWSTTYVFKQLMADRFSHGRAFLVGDAAHLYAPYGARGLNSGFADADNLAWKLAWVLHGRAPATLLDSYDLERRAAATEHFRATSATAGFMAPTTRRGRLYRDAVLAVAARVPAVRRFVDSGRFYAPVGYPSSPITTPDAGAAGAGGGAMMPDAPLVLLPDRRPGRLRDLVGNAFLLVHAAPDVRCATEVRAALADGLAERAPEVTHLAVLPPGTPGPGAGCRLPGAAEARLPGELGAPAPGTTTAGWLLLVRPDCHVAARVALPSAAVARSRVRGLLDRACGRTTGPVAEAAPSTPGPGS